jgi:hypothetical protein
MSNLTASQVAADYSLRASGILFEFPFSAAYLKFVRYARRIQLTNFK